MNWRRGCCLLSGSTIHKLPASLTKIQFIGSRLSVLRLPGSYGDAQHSCPSTPVISTMKISEDELDMAIVISLATLPRVLLLQ